MFLFLDCELILNLLFLVVMAAFKANPLDRIKSHTEIS